MRIGRGSNAGDRDVPHIGRRIHPADSVHRFHRRSVRDARLCPLLEGIRVVPLFRSLRIGMLSWVRCPLAQWRLPLWVIAMRNRGLVPRPSSGWEIERRVASYLRVFVEEQERFGSLLNRREINPGNLQAALGLGHPNWPLGSNFNPFTTLRIGFRRSYAIRTAIACAEESFHLGGS